MSFKLVTAVKQNDTYFKGTTKLLIFSFFTFYKIFKFCVIGQYVISVNISKRYHMQYLSNVKTYNKFLLDYLFLISSTNTIKFF